MTRARPLRVGLDGRALSFPAGGIRRYAANLMAALGRVASATEFIVVGPGPGMGVPPGLSVRPASLSLPTNAGWMLTGVPLAIRGARLDLFHALAYTAPIVATPPIVLTVHDVSYARAPGDYPYRIDPLRRWFYRASARRATAVITDSAFSAREIEAAYDIPRASIAIVPLAADPCFLPLPAGAAPTTVPGCGTDPYLLHVGDLHRRRRVGLLLDATLEVRRRHPDTLGALALVLIGRDHGEAAGLVARAAAAGAPDAVRVLGVRSDDDLVAAMQGAAAFVYASRYEGFGLPVLEAMACGTPVVAAAEASVPEIVGDAGRLVASAGPSTLAEAIADVLLVPGERERLRAAGLARAARFSWDRTAEATLAVYARVAAERGR